MSKTKKKQSWLRMHPVHFHVGMYVAIAALLITAMKSSEGIVAAVYREHGQGGNILSETHLREAETHTAHAQLSLARPARVSGT
jgi:hypothetical protein